MSSSSYIHRPHTTPMKCKLLFHYLAEQAVKFPNKEAFVLRDEKGNRKALTFKEYQEQSQYLAAGLLELGLGRGDKVLVMLTNSTELIIVHMALNRIGALVVVMEPTTDMSLIDSQFWPCVICSADLYTGVISVQNHADTSGEIASLRESLQFKLAVVVGSIECREEWHDAIAYEHLVKKGEENLVALARAEAEVQMDDPSLIIFTSGSTGIPKPVKYTHQGFMQGLLLNGSYVCDISSDAVFFCDAPFDWIVGLHYFSLVPLHGITYVSFPPHLAVKGHVTGDILKVFEEERVSKAVLLAYFLLDMTTYGDFKRYDLSSLKRIVTGGQMTERTLVKQLLELLPGIVISITYAATEFNGSAVTVLTRDNVDSDEYGSYDVIPGYEAMVADDQGRIVRRGTPGEIYIRGAGLYQDTDSLEVLGMRYKTPKTATGWHRTSDWGAITENGKLRILGRVDHLIKCATESIQPAETEYFLSSHPNVAAVVVVGVPDERLYEVVCACVILKSCPHGNQKETIAELDDWCADKFPCSSTGMSAQPRHYVVLESFPVTRTGKTDRKKLKKIAREKLGM